MNTLLMDPYESQYGLIDSPYQGILDRRDHPLWAPIRRNMGYSRQYALRMDLNHSRPMNELSSSGYCLANPGTEYLIFIPDGMRVEVDLNEASGTYAVEWYDPMTGTVHEGKPTEGNKKRWFISPFASHAVLFLRRCSGK